MQTTIDIAATPQAVWDVVTDLDRLGEWVSIHDGFASEPPQDVATGAQFEQKLKVAGTPFAVRWTAETVEEPARLTWTGVGPAGSAATTAYELSEHDGGTRFSYTNEFSLPGGKLGEAAGQVAAGAADREADDSLARLKALVEA